MKSINNHHSYDHTLLNKSKNQQPLTMSKKTTCWRLSAAKKLLIFDIQRGKDLLPNGKEKQPRDVFVMRPEYERYKYDNFRTNLRKLRNDIEADRETAIVEAAAVAQHRTKHPPQSNGFWPRWPGHPAKHLLRMDIDQEEHTIQTPAELYASRAEYREFPLKVFRDHIYKEIKAQKQVHWNTVKEFEDEDDSEIEFSDDEESEGESSDDENEE
jgi:hypothetical protein